MPATRYLYVTRHAEATADESALTEAGRRQAALLGERLAGVGLTAVRHGPSARAEETARIVCERVVGVSAEAAEEAGDYPPYLPRREELPAESADATVERLAGLSAEERAAGPALAHAAEARFTGPAEGTRPGTNSSSPTPSSPPGSSATRSTPRPGAGSASTTPTRA